MTDQSIGDTLGELKRTRQLVVMMVGNTEVTLCPDAESAAEACRAGRIGLGPYWVKILALVRQILGGRVERVVKL
jgi:hypothetical protein